MNTLAVGAASACRAWKLRCAPGSGHVSSAFVEALSPLFPRQPLGAALRRCSDVAGSRSPLRAGGKDSFFSATPAHSSTVRSLSSGPGAEDGYKAFLLDMDGVLHRYGNAVDGAGEFLEDLLNQAMPFTVITNEDRYTTQALQAKLEHVLGVKVPEEQIYTAANSVRDFFLSRTEKGWKGNVFVIGEEGLRWNVQNAIERDPECKVYTNATYSEGSSPHCEFVVVGTVVTGGPNDSWVNAEIASTLLRNGAKLIYSNPDWYEVTSDGHFKFGCPMPVVNLLMQTTGCSAYNLGKPNPFILRRAHRQLTNSLYSALTARQRSLMVGHIDPTEVLFVGDSMDTDIRTAMENGIDSALVLSGTTTVDKLKASALKPTHVFECIQALHQEFRAGSLRRSIMDGSSA
eukprot:TRINITY_DN80445_c0_g1_i1.p1 TRINITY_DN80445_c0_g1~~TRINITY_DN80445_c0_g1_i1.p1  ORF type:complete len:402 (-),score=73.33 TRINITY_DN80445_c0_g1_i1:302-1507(-)